MAGSEKVTVDKAYFDALLRRADFHTSTQLFGHVDPASVTISRVEYDSLLRISREYEHLKNALFQGGIAAETLDLLVSGAQNNDQRNDSGFEQNDLWSRDFEDHTPGNEANPFKESASELYQTTSYRSGAPVATFSLTSGPDAFRNGHAQPSHLRVPQFKRQVSYGMTSAPEDVAFEDDESLDEGNRLTTDLRGLGFGNERRTIYLSGFSERTTYRDLLSVIKGGKLLNIHLRSERSATVTFFEGAVDFLAWAKRNDIYLHSKRVEVKWADRQYRMNGHIANKIGNGATRNIVIHSVVEKGLTEAQIRADMEHIHNLIIIDITFRGDDALVSTNSVHNALFARTCMMSRATYKGCKVEFYRDECDVPLPGRTYMPKLPIAAPARKRPTVTNRFDMLKIDGVDGSSNEERSTPSENEPDDKTIEVHQSAGVSLR